MTESFYGIDGRHGSVLDRNVELTLPAPAWLAAS
jgi:hypothetical protein